MGMSWSHFSCHEPQQQLVLSEWRQKLGTSKRSHDDLDEFGDQHDGFDVDVEGHEDTIPRNEPDGPNSHVLGPTKPAGGNTSQDVHNTLGLSFEDFVDYTLWGS